QNPTSALLSWLEPDNGGSPVTGYNIYRGNFAGLETFIAHVDGELTNKYLDQSAPNTSNWYYKVTAVNAVGESTYCHELNVDGVQPGQTACQLPYIQVQDGAASITPDPTGQFTIQRVNLGEPFMGCGKKGITATLKVNTMDPSSTGTAVVPPVSTYIVYFKIPGSANSTGQPQTMYVSYDNTTNPAGEFDFGWIDPATGSECTTLLTPIDPHPLTGSVAADGTITFNFDFTAPVEFASCKAAATIADEMFIQPELWKPGLEITNIQAKTYQRAGGILSGARVNRATTTGDGTYTTIGNLGCLDIKPRAVLTANPQAGSPPLQVTFSGAASNDANPCTS